MSIKLPVLTRKSRSTMGDNERQSRKNEKKSRQPTVVFRTPWAALGSLPAGQRKRHQTARGCGARLKMSRVRQGMRKSDLSGGVGGGVEGVDQGVIDAQAEEAPADDKGGPKTVPACRV